MPGERANRLIVEEPPEQKSRLQLYKSGASHYCQADRPAETLQQPSRTLRDAPYITKLHDADEWQAAMQALLLVAEQDGPPMFARIGIMRALNRGYVREFNTSRKDTLWASGNWNEACDDNTQNRFCISRLVCSIFLNCICRKL
jgi:hypothetical protein